MTNSYRERLVERVDAYNTSTAARCNVVNPRNYNLLIARKESVESYRGKPQYIDVGSKRRKVFNDFHREVVVVDDHEANWFCGSRVCYTSGHQPFNQVVNPAVQSRYIWDEYPGNYTGDAPLLIMPVELKKLGDEYREFVIRDMYAKANSPRFDGAVFLAELDETLVDLRKLLGNTVKSLFRLKALKGNLKHIASSPEELWLWWRYMLLPTMMDAEDLLTALRPERIIDRIQDGSSSMEPLETSGTISHGLWWNSIWMEMPWQIQTTWGCGGALDIISRDDPHPWGTSNWDLVRGTWERIPFSFIADWFVNVGDWLASLRKLEIVYAQSYATYAVESKMVMKAPQWTSDEDYKVRVYVMDRITNVEPPTLPLVDKRWANVLRTIDLISLSIGTIKSVLKRRK